MSLIPKVIYQSWKTKNLSEKMTEAVNKVKELNPEYKYELWDDNDCRQFLLEHFGINYANAFDAILPGAFKCDFWRYCVLYIYGGIYMDIDMLPLVPFKEMIKDNDKFVSIVDYKHKFTPDCCIYQAFIASVPKHPILYYSITMTFSNIVSRRLEMTDRFSITGPVVVGIAINIFKNNKNTHQEIQPGEHEGNLRLHKMKGYYTVDINDKKLILNRFDGYGDSTYHTMDIYSDDPRSKFRKNIKYIVIPILVIAIIGILLSIIFGIKWKKCQESC
jgi:mannosyltransferase OCH1-like enzyme